MLFISVMASSLTASKPKNLGDFSDFVAFPITTVFQTWITKTCKTTSVLGLEHRSRVSSVQRAHKKRYVWADSTAEHAIRAVTIRVLDWKLERSVERVEKSRCGVFHCTDVNRHQFENSGKKTWIFMKAYRTHILGRLLRWHHQCHYWLCHRCKNKTRHGEGGNCQVDFWNCWSSV